MRFLEIFSSGPNAGQLIQPGQGNNVYIFPGVSLACILSGVRHIPARAFLVAAKAVAKEVSFKIFRFSRLFESK